MASFSNPSKTYAIDKLSRCAIMVLLVYSYLYRKRSKVNNVNAEAKEQGKDMQTPVDDSGIFTEVSRSGQAFPLVLVGAPRKESLTRAQLPVGYLRGQPQAFPTRKWVPDVPLGKPLPDAPRRLHYQASGQNAAGLVPSGTQWRPHHKRGWCDLARLQAPPMYNNGACKHRVERGMQTSLNTRPKPRASA